MSNDEKILSDYIDNLNEEKMPKEHGFSEASPDQEKLFETVRLVRSLREPALPDHDFPKKLAQNAAKQLGRERSVKRTKRAWFIGVAAVAAAIMVAVMLNFAAPFNNGNTVYAMEQAFKGIKAYHGILEIVETNGEGKNSTQAKLEIWADKEGHYYTKELEGLQEGLITVNNGQKKWQLRPEEKQVHIFSSFPDPYRFTFELGNEIEEVKSAISTTFIGEEVISGRKAEILEISPQGGVPYKLWIDKETKLPLQKQSGMQNALQYTATYVQIDFNDAIPVELTNYNLPSGFKEIDTNPEQIVSNLSEAREIAGFIPNIPETAPEGYSIDSIAVLQDAKIVKLYYDAKDKAKKVVILQSKSDKEFKPAATAVIGKVGNSIAEIQSPVEEGAGILGGGGPYAGVTDLNSIRWQQEDFEYAVVGDISLNEMAEFIKCLKLGEVQIHAGEAGTIGKPRVQVPVDLKIEESEQKSADGGHSPWRLDPAFVAQVFVSLKISPEGIKGEYPIKYEELKVVENTGTDSVVEVKAANTPVKMVYLKKLIRQDNTGIWTVVGYDPE